MPVVDYFRPELIEDAKEAEWGSISCLVDFTGASLYTPLDRFGRRLPAFVMANSEEYSPSQLDSFVDHFCKTPKPIDPLLFSMQDKLGLSAIDYACFSPHVEEAGDFLLYAICQAIYRGDPIPKPDLNRLAAITFAADCFENMRRAKVILKDYLPRQLQQTRNLILTTLSTEMLPKHEDRLHNGFMRGGIKDISRRFSQAEVVWRGIKIPNVEAVDYAPDEAEYLLGNHVSNGKPVKPVDKQVRDLLVTHLSKISVPALN